MFGRLRQIALQTLWEEMMLCDCPHCNKPIASDELPDAQMLRHDDGDFHFFHRDCALERGRERQRLYLANHVERRRREDQTEG